MAELVLSLAT